MDFGVGIASASDSWKVAQRAEALGFTRLVLRHADDYRRPVRRDGGGSGRV
jgi:hypothetical protein